MKKGLWTGLSAGILACAWGGSAQAFDTHIIHPKLSRSVAAAYNSSHPERPLTPDQVKRLEAGSIDEDEPSIRSLNHFFNPQTGKGLTIAGVRVGWPSPEWSSSSIKQSLELKNGDCTWQRAIDEYRRAADKAGDDGQAFQCLGQVLHLLEDAAVPAHTRDDHHLEGDPFEQWLKRNDPAVSPAAEANPGPSCRTHEDCIKELARWINEGFVSQDTISATPLPLPVAEAAIEGDYLMRNGRRLAAYNPKNKDFTLPEGIQAGYWQEISPIMVRYGVRLIEIFFEEAAGQPAKDSSGMPAPLRAQFGPLLPSWLGPALGAVDRGAANAAKTVKSVSATVPRAQSDAGSSSLGQAGRKKEAAGSDERSSASAEPLAAPETNSNILENILPLGMRPQPAPAPSLVLLPRLHGGGRGNSTEATTPAEPVLPNTFILEGPPPLSALHEVSFVFGSDAPEAVFECSFDSERWKLCDARSSMPVSEMASTIYVRAVLPAGSDPSPAEYRWQTDWTAPTAMIIGLAESYEKSGFTVAWEAEDASGIASYDVEYRRGAGEWETFAPNVFVTVKDYELAAQDGEEISFRVRATDTAGNTGPWSEAALTRIVRPIAEALSQGLEAVWHFDECRGRTAESISGMDFPEPADWIVGKYGCGFSQTWNSGTHLRWSLPQPLNAPEMTLSFYMRESRDRAGHVWLLDETGNFRAGLSPSAGNTSVVYNGSYFPLDASFPNTDDWHLATIVYSGEYLAWYVDGVLVKRLEGDFRVSHPITSLYASQENFPWQLDEIVLWSRALSGEEAAALAAVGQLAPRTSRSPQASASLLHYWDFNEAAGIAFDKAGNAPLLDIFRTGGWQGNGAYFSWPGKYQVELTLPAIDSMDLSLSYWRKDGPLNGGASGTGGPSLTNSLSGEGFGVIGYDPSYYFHNFSLITAGRTVPLDDHWHHIALVYDSYAYRLTYYVDGVEKSSRPAIWLHPGFDRLIISERQGTFSMDELRIWQGALTPFQVSELAQNSPENE